jgi:hypothetical protein
VTAAKTGSVASCPIDSGTLELMGEDVMELRSGRLTYRLHASRASKTLQSWTSAVFCGLK